MKKKVLFVIDSLHSGGAEKSLVSLLSLFDYENYDVDLLTFKQGGLYVPLLSKNVTLINSPDIFSKMELSISNLIKSKEYKIALWRVNTSISLRVKSKITNIKHGAQLMWTRLDNVIPKLDEEYDVAIAYSQGTPTYYVAEKVSAKKKLCWVNIDYKFAGYNRKFDFEYYEKFNNIVAVSKVCTDVLKDVFPEFKDKIITIYDIISENLIKDMANEGQGFIDEYKGIRILTIGRLVYQKGYEYAIEAAKYLKNKNIDFRWYVIGEGDLKNQLKNIVKDYNLQDNFKFLGTFTNPYPFIKECNIYCQPSRFEGFGLAIAEARILNKPIVATNFDIVYDQIRDGENGLIAEMNGYSVSKNIQRLIEEKNLKRKIINNIKMEQVSTEREIEKVLKLLE
ncbi:glycosyltransferase [Clostridium saudiense]|uniref:glycosyltransferase n=1 Tax=Clostridium saudiense TaxID=1414720 RepID=UPI0018AA8D49|nr:glycosyltransferase [Clostridium saudiense]